MGILDDTLAKARQLAREARWKAETVVRVGAKLGAHRTLDVPGARAIARELSRGRANASTLFRVYAASFPDRPALIQASAPDRREPGPLEARRLTYAEVDHRNWLKSLESFLSATKRPPPETEAGACRFGEWHLGDEGRRYEHLPEFEAVGALHGATHEIAREIVAFAQAGNARMAQSRLEDLRTRHDALISSLHALSAAIANNNRR